MKRTTILLCLILLSLIFNSCKKEVNESISADYTVIDFYYGYDNYNRNIRDSKKNPLIIRERNIVEINLDKNGNCVIEGKNIPQDSITNELKKYIIPHPENKNMPETLEKELTHAGKVYVNYKLVISVRIDENLSYKKYSEIRNKIYIANNEVRNDFAIDKFGKELSELIVPSSEIEREQYYELLDIFPFKYVEFIPE